MPLSEEAIKHKKEYTANYRKTKLKRVPLDLQLEDYERLKACADSQDEAVNTFIKKAINERLEKLS